MTVAAPPRGPEIERDRDLEERVADLEALIEEARGRARRRRQRIGVAVLLLAAALVAALIGFGGHGGGAGSAATARARGPQSSAGNAESPPLGALPPQAGLVDEFAFDPRNPEIVYVLSRVFSNTTSHVFKTTDGGGHWKATAASGSGWAGSSALTADPRHPGTLYVGTQVAVYKTVDGGRNWLPSHRGLIVPPRSEFGKWVISLAVDPANTNIVYAGSDRVSKSTDGGYSWQTVFPPHPTRYPAEHVSALAIAPSRPETIYAITGDYANPAATPAYGHTTIYKSTDAGVTWQATTVVHGSVAPTALAVDPRHPATVYAAIGANLLKTTNAGETWQPIGSRFLPIGHTRGTCHCLDQGGVKTLAVDPRRSGAVYASLTQGGIYKTSNGGRTWSRTTNCAPVNQPGFNANCPDPALLYLPIVAVDPARPATVYAAAQSETGDGPRILRSTNSGRSWTSAR